MRTILLTLLAGSLLASCKDASSDKKTGTTDTTMNQPVQPLVSLTDEEKAEGWMILFDGQSTKGWHQYGGAAVGSAWKIADGTIYLDTTSKKDGKIEGGGDILTDEEFENFHLKLEWKIAPGGNSGIIFYVNEDTAIYKRPYETGPEMQVLDNAGHADAKIIKHRAGDLYDLISCSKETVTAAGEWNKAEIKSVNGKLDFYLNGENVVSTQLWDENWTKMVAASKFKQWPGFGTFKKGRICLQDHDNTVWYRNVKLRKL
ncbi:MAG: DUF1080 domain-containing protein [Chitinophagaceae bacterium]|nr:DUF1080 domain-containing protein [Chitinophagaceae bacterium]